ncbi:tripartite tricarboxylate transporter permease [Rhodobacteraceae bacterium D3-12]|nr:tripartite tricarboxylate transporter permease [Rhodobacteraceae bacterium D3-12]
MEGITTGFAAVLDPMTICWVFVGVFVGYVVGAIPGMGKGVTVAVSIPLTFYMTPIIAISFLVGIAKGSTAGSAVSAILLNVPGEASSAPTALDGFPLSQQGKSQKALKMGLYASVIGDLVSTVALILLAPPLASFALLISPIEMAAILLFSLTFIAGLAGGSLERGLIAGMFGLLVATVGAEPETAIERFTYGFLELYDGLAIVPVAIGMLATSEMVAQIAQSYGRRKNHAAVPVAKTADDKRVTKDDWRRSGPSIARGTVIGIGIGILPGLGASIASFLSYGAAKRASKTPEKFGQGAIEGVAASESADNAVVPASFVPLFALGIPGSVIAAVLIGAFVIHGVTPGPMMFVRQPELVYGIYAAMILASFALLTIGSVGQRFFSWVVTLPMKFIAPTVVYFCALGAYLEGGGIFDVSIMIIFGVIGFFAKKYDYSFVTFLIGFVVGPAFELALRQSIALTNGDPRALVEHPIAIVFLLLTLLAVWRFAAFQKKQRREKGTPS